MSFSDLPDHVVAMIAAACPEQSRADLAMASKGLAAHVARTTAARPIRIALLDIPRKLRWASSAADWGAGKAAQKLTRAIVLRGDASLLAHAWRASGRRLDLDGVLLLSAWSGSVACLRWACGKMALDLSASPAWDHGFRIDRMEFVRRAFSLACAHAAETGRLGTLECLVALFGNEWVTPRDRYQMEYTHMIRTPYDTHAKILRLLGDGRGR